MSCNDLLSNSGVLVELNLPAALAQKEHGVPNASYIFFTCVFLKYTVYVF